MRIGLLTVLALAGCSSPGGNGFQDAFRITDQMRAAALESADISAMRGDLDYIAAWHVDRRTGVAGALKPGLDDAALDAMEAELGCKLPRELRALWRWRDGYPETATADSFVWYHRLMPADEAMQQYRILRSQHMFGWDRSWFPVMFFQGEWYFVECAPATVEASPLMYYFAETGPQEAYRSLTSYFATAREAMENGGVSVVGPDAEMDADIKVLAAAHAKHNPGIAFPYHVPERNREQ